MDGPGGLNWMVLRNETGWPKGIKVDGPKSSKWTARKDRSERSKRLKVDGPKNGRSKEKQLED